MFIAVGTGAYASGIFHLVTHAFFKALLFLGAGSVIHAMHHAYHATHSHADAQDMRNMGGLKQSMPVTFWLMLIATLAIAGIPPLSGFFSKDEILAAAFARAGNNPAYYVFYAMGVVAALLTAFYMARLITMTFLGENRTGEQERSHIHDAPQVMTGPLVVLGVLSAIGGFLNLPPFFGGGALLEHWLEPVTEPAARFFRLEMPHGQTELFLVGGAVLVSVLGLFAGYLATSRRRIPTAAEAPDDTGLARVLNRKYYVDEIYDAVLVRPLVWLSRVVLWKGVDQGVVDGAAVNGTARLSRGLGWLGSRLQTGQVGVYVVLFLVGALWILHAMAR
jgi:NADH-quinone oxidoreductase subunit L